MIQCQLVKLFALTDSIGESPLSRLEKINSIKTVKAKWKLVVIIDEIKNVLAPTLKPRQELLEKYGERDPQKPNIWRVLSEHSEEYFRQAIEFGETVVSLDVTPLKVEDLEGCDIEVGDMILLKLAGLLVE